MAYPSWRERHPSKTNTHLGTFWPAFQTPVGMAAPLVHLNPDVFADPMDFRPERFIENPQLKRYLMTFSQGSRQCLGMQLAYTELFLMHSEIWRRFGTKENHGEDGYWELFETDRSDTDMASDRFVPYPKADSKGIRIKVRKWGDVCEEVYGVLWGIFVLRKITRRPKIDDRDKENR